MTQPNYKRSFLNLWDETERLFRIQQTSSSTTMFLNSNTLRLSDGTRSVLETISELQRIQPIHSQIASIESRTVISEGQSTSLTTRASGLENSIASEGSKTIRALNSLTSLSTRADSLENSINSQGSIVSRSLDSLVSLSSRAGEYENSVFSQGSLVIQTLNSQISLSTRAGVLEVDINSQGSLVIRALNSQISLSTRAGVLEADISSQGSLVIRALDSQISLSTRASGLESSIGSVSVRTDSALGSITSLSTRAGVYESDTNSLSSRMDIVLRPGPTVDTTTISGLPVYSSGSSWPNGVLHPNGKIYGIPRYATSVLIVDPSTNTADTTTLPTGIASGNNWVGTTLHPNGKIYGTPYGSGNVLIADPINNTVDNTSIQGLTYGGNRHLGGAVHSNGKIYYLPFSAAHGRVAIIDPDSPVTSISGVVASTSSYNNTTRVLNCPGASFTTSLTVGDNILISTSSASYTGYVQSITDDTNVVFVVALGVSLSSGTITSIQKTRRADITTITNLNLSFGGAVFANGKIYGVPRSGRVAIIDPDSPVTSISGVVNSTSSYNNTTRVLNCPGASFTTSLAVGDNILISTSTNNYTGIVESITDNQNVVLLFALGINLSTGTITSIQKTRRVDVTTITVSNFFSWGGVLAPNGKIYMTPSDGGQTILVIDPQTNTTSTISIDRADEIWHGQGLTPDGNIYIIGTKTLLKLDTNTHTITTTSFSGLSSQFPIYANNKLYLLPGRADYIAIIDLIAKSLESLSTRAGYLETHISSYGLRTDSALSRIDSLSTRASDLESRISSLGTRTDIALASETSLTTRVSGMESGIGSLSSRMANVLAMHPPVGMTSNNSGGYIASASNQVSSTFGAAFRAFDYNFTTFFSSQNESTGFYTNGIYPNNGSSFTVIDSPSSTYYGEWIQLQLQAPIVLQQFHIIPRYNVETFAPKDFVILGSNNGTNWTQIQSYSNTTYSVWPNKKFFSVTSPSIAYSYYRMAVNKIIETGANINLCITEWILYESSSVGQLDSLASRASLLDASISIQGSRMTQVLSAATYPLVGLTANSSNGYIASASTQASVDFQAFYAFDSLDSDYETNVYKNYWSSNSTYSAGTYTGSVSTIVDGVDSFGEWLQIQLPDPIILNSFILTPRRDWWMYGYASPIDFIIAGSNNGSSWTSVFSSINTNWTDEYPRVFTVSNPSVVAYRYYRLITNKIASGRSQVQITEWRLTTNVGLIPSLTTRASVLESGIASLGTRTTSVLGSLTSLSTRASIFENQTGSLGVQMDSALMRITSLSTRASGLESGIGSLGFRVESNATSIVSLSTRMGAIESNNYSYASRMTVVEYNLNEAKQALLAIFDGNPTDANYSTLQLITTTIGADPNSFSVQRIQSRLDYVNSVIERLIDSSED